MGIAVKELAQFAASMQERVMAYQLLESQRSKRKQQKKHNKGIRRKKNKKKHKAEKENGKISQKDKGKSKDTDADSGTMSIHDGEHGESDAEDEFAAALKASKLADERVEEDSFYIFRILLPFLSNLFGGAFNPLELYTPSDTAGINQSGVSTLLTITPF